MSIMDAGGDLVVTKTPDVRIGVRHLTLVDGESLIALVWFNEKTRVYTLDYPVFPNLTQNPNTGRPGVSLLPLRPYIKQGLKKIDVHENHIVYIAEIREDMEKLYTQYNSDIVLADVSDMKRIIHEA